MYIQDIICYIIIMYIRVPLYAHVSSFPDPLCLFLSEGSWEGTSTAKGHALGIPKLVIQSFCRVQVALQVLQAPSSALKLFTCPCRHLFQEIVKT